MSWVKYTWIKRSHIAGNLFYAEKKNTSNVYIGASCAGGMMDAEGRFLGNGSVLHLEQFGLHNSTYVMDSGPQDFRNGEYQKNYILRELNMRYLKN